MRLTAILLLVMTSPSQAEVPRVVTDFGPVQSLVSDVMGELGSPVALLPAGSDPHDFQLRPSQAASLAGADLVFWVGPELVPTLGDALNALAPQAKIVTLLSEGGSPQRHFSDGAVDPHAWLDPTIAISWLKAIERDLSAKDPEHAATYAANAARATLGLQALDHDLAAMLAPVRTRPFVTYHDAFGYFADHYGLAQAGAIQLSDASSPSAAQLAKVRDILAASSAICVFPEAGRDPKFIASLTEGLQVTIGAAQDIEFVATVAGPGQYEVLLRALGAGLVDCLSRD